MRISRQLGWLTTVVSLVSACSGDTSAATDTSGAGGASGAGPTGSVGGAGGANGGAAGSTAGGGAGSGERDAPSEAVADGGIADVAGDVSIGDSGGSACQGSTWTVGDTSGSLSFGGQTRTYSLHVPAGFTGTTLVPLVLDFHGLLSTAASEKSGSGWVAVSNQNGFVLVHPQGVGNSWNLMTGAGGCCPPAFDQNIDDVGFVRALIDKLKSEGCVDPKRIYATGLSNGGGMSLRLACDAADVIAAIAPYSFDLIQNQPCAPSRAIGMFDYRGTADNLVPYDGGTTTIPGDTRQVTFTGAKQTFETVRTLNGCTGTPLTTHGNCSTYSACTQGVETTLCTVQSGGHTWGDSSVAWSVLKNYALP